MSRLAALCCLVATLALALTWELLPPEHGTDGPAAIDAPHPLPTTGAGLDKTAQRGFDAAALADLAVSITERPLFSPSRRPADRPANVTTAAPAGDGLPRLTGVIVGPSGGRAIFAGADGKSHTAAEGDAIGAFQVRSIGPGVVTLSGSEGDRVLRPTYIASSVTNGTTPPAGTVPWVGNAPRIGNGGARTREDAR